MFLCKYVSSQPHRRHQGEGLREVRDGVMACPPRCPWAWGGRVACSTRHPIPPHPPGAGAVPRGGGLQRPQVPRGHAGGYGTGGRGDAGRAGRRARPPPALLAASRPRHVPLRPPPPSYPTPRPATHPPLRSRCAYACLGAHASLRLRSLGCRCPATTRAPLSACGTAAWAASRWGAARLTQRIACRVTETRR
jgi:hypothetical protein